MSKAKTGAPPAGKKRGEAYQPERGHFVYLDFTPHAGTEQAGRRPALILSPVAYNVATGLAFACPVTNQMKGGAFDVAIPPAARVSGAVLSNQLRSVDWIARNAAFHSLAPEETVLEVLARIEAVLALNLDS